MGILDKLFKKREKKYHPDIKSIQKHLIQLTTQNRGQLCIWQYAGGDEFILVKDHFTFRCIKTSSPEDRFRKIEITLNVKRDTLTIYLYSENHSDIDYINGVWDNALQQIIVSMKSDLIEYGPNHKRQKQLRMQRQKRERMSSNFLIQILEK